MKHFLWCIWEGLTLVGLNCLGAGSVPAFDVDPTEGFHEFELQRTNGMYGWSFSIVEPVTVTTIGWYDDGLNGLFHSHQVGLWPGGLNTPGGDLIGTVTIPAGTNAPLDGVYRKMDLPAALTLAPGDYIVAGTHLDENQDFVYFINPYVLDPTPGDPRFRVGGPAIAFGNDFRRPDLFILAYGLELGPMLFVEPIPEPSGVCLALAGALGVWTTRARRSTMRSGHDYC